MFTTLSTAPTVAIETHGCKLNQADSLQLAYQFESAGCTVVDDQAQPDIYIVNTCTVTHIADRKGRQALRSARRRNPTATIVATGCYPERAIDELKAMGEVDLVLGNMDKQSLVHHVLSLDAPNWVQASNPEPLVAFGRTRSMVKIQEGCDQVCAYCIVPKVRGREVSIPPDEITSLIKRHVDKGAKEIVLTGTQLGTYGFEYDHKTNLSALIRRILREGEMSRLRISSLQPQEIDSELLQLWDDDRLAPHFHIPLQSGSDQTLQTMRRRYTSQLYSKVLRWIRESVPNVSITTDVIVGFPGETDEQFQETYSLCHASEFASIHVFPYSARPGTSAAHFPLHVDPETKATRVQELLKLTEDHSHKFRTKMLNTAKHVLLERKRSDGNWVGLTDNYVKVGVSAGKDLTNQFQYINLLKVENDLVIGELVD